MTDSHSKKHSPDDESVLKDLFQGQDPKEKIKELATEADQLVKKHPWIAVLGALAIGYALGSLTNRCPPDRRR